METEYQWEESLASGRCAPAVVFGRPGYFLYDAFGSIWRLDQIPGLLSRHEKRVVFRQIVEGSTAEQYEETFFWLADSMIVNECRRTNDPNVGLSLNESDTYIKCYRSKIRHP